MSKLLVRSLKESREDFEFYPTTREIITQLIPWFHSDRVDQNKSLLDIGAGNGKVFDTLESLGVCFSEKFAIEKSPILRQNMDRSIFVVGTDFHTTTLIDKKVDVAFCNPPYRQYAAWASKIILEANAHDVFLVIPKRWQENAEIKAAAKARNVNLRVISSHDFLNAEDRTARAKVDLIHIKMGGRYGCGDVTDPFKLWFDANFKGDEPVDTSIRDNDAARSNLVKGAAYIPNLVNIYNDEMTELIESFRQIVRIPPKLLNDIGVDKEHVITAFKQKISNLKEIYWQEVFSNLESIRDRLTSKTRDKFRDRMMRNVHVEFTAENIYAVVQWIIANANEYFDEQLLEVYKDLTEPKNVINYKSNRVLVNGLSRWEFGKKASKFMLEYRLVHEMPPRDNYSYGRVNGLHRDSATFLQDMITIGETLGFAVESRVEDFEWTPGCQYDLQLTDGETFMQVRVYKNGNIHLKMNVKFMKAFNLQAGRLLGWLRSPKHAADETGYSIEECQQFMSPDLTQLAPQKYLALPSGGTD